MAAAAGLVLYLLAPTVLRAGADASHVEEVKTWREGRVDRLKKYYLSLVGLYWLETGEHTFGSDPSSDLVFSKPGTPAAIGTFRLDDNGMTVEIHNSEAGVMHDGEPVTSMTMYPRLFKSL